MGSVLQIDRKGHEINVYDGAVRISHLSGGPCAVDGKTLDDNGHVVITKATRVTCQWEPIGAMILLETVKKADRPGDPEHAAHPDIKRNLSPKAESRRTSKTPPPKPEGKQETDRQIAAGVKHPGNRKVDAGKTEVKAELTRVAKADAKAVKAESKAKKAAVKKPKPSVKKVRAGKKK